MRAESTWLLQVGGAIFANLQQTIRQSNDAEMCGAGIALFPRGRGLAFSSRLCGRQIISLEAACGQAPDLASANKLFNFVSDEPQLQSRNRGQRLQRARAVPEGFPDQGLISSRNISPTHAELVLFGSTLIATSLFQTQLSPEAAWVTTPAARHSYWS